MAKSHSIPRAPDDPDGLEFESLTQEGIATLQELCGNRWTDFNVHDPGVTILDQLCYGLVDLGYQSGFDVRDYLASPDGSLDLEGQALFPPERIFPGGPITGADFSMVVFSEIPEVEDAYMDDVAPGFHRLHVRLEPGAQVGAEMRRTLDGFRPLGEDFERVDRIAVVPCFLSGTVNVGGARPRDEIFAEIYFRCGRRIATDNRIRRYDEEISSGRSLESILTGPLARAGVLDAADFRSAQSLPGVAELVGLILGVEGVESVSGFAVLDAAGLPISERPDRDYGLDFPSPDAAGPRLRVVPERRISLDRFLADARRHLDRFEFDDRARRRGGDPSEQLPKPPRGRDRELSAYFSVQEDFPPAYGIGRHGVPHGASTAAKASARQLKAYLYPFEQLMADYLETLRNLPRIYSTDATLERTCFPAVLDDRRIPGIESLYSQEGRSGGAARVLARYGEFDDRRGRVLDLMLAMYGETFPDELLRRYNPCRPSDVEVWIRENKIRLLCNLPALGARRAEPRYWRLRISILLGLEHLESDRRLSRSPRARKVVSEAEYPKKPSTFAVRRTEALAPVGLPPLSATGRGAKAPDWISCISEGMLRSGTDSHCYRTLEQDGRTLLVFCEAEGESAWALVSCRSRDEAARAALQLRDWIAQENRDIEGFHVVEHVRLRPRTRALASDDKAWEWFGLQVSVVLPGWTARFSNDEFRCQAEDLITQRTPAHVLATCIWLSMDQMRVFEILHRRWARALESWEADPERPASALDARSMRLVRFLHRAHQARPVREWY